MRDLGVLVVNDDSATLGVIERMFGYFKVKVDCVTNASAALESLKKEKYRTLITDLDMPDMDGFELVRTAREQRPDLNIVLFTGTTTPNIIDLALNAKITELYFKPSGLHNMLSSVISRETGKTFLLE